MATALRTVMSAHRRKEIEAEIAGCLQRVDLLIARLDREDAPFEDLEDDDPAGGAVDDTGEPNENFEEGIRIGRPRYGVDQSTGPINVREVNLAWHRRLVSR